MLTFFCLQWYYNNYNYYDDNDCVCVCVCVSNVQTFIPFLVCTMNSLGVFPGVMSVRSLPYGKTLVISQLKLTSGRFIHYVIGWSSLPFEPSHLPLGLMVATHLGPMQKIRLYYREQGPSVLAMAVNVNLKRWTNKKKKERKKRLLLKKSTQKNKRRNFAACKARRQRIKGRPVTCGGTGMSDIETIAT